MSAVTPRRQLLRPRTSQTKLKSTSTSTPNLSSAYSNSAVPPVPKLALTQLGAQGQQQLLPRKTSLNALTKGSLESIPDASGSYALSTVLDEDENGMSYSPQRGGEGEVDVGDLVDVPGGMHGTVKFLGRIDGKDGVFAGVELSREYAGRGKNNGDVDGVSYFRTSAPGAGIFLPISRAVPRGSGRSGMSTPRTPSALGGRPGYSFTPPTPAIPSNFSQSVGPGSRAQSPFGKKPRPSLPRPESPIRRQQTLTPGPNRSQYGGGTPQPNRGFASPAPGKFGQSVRGTRDTSGDPPKKLFQPRSNLKASVGPRSQSRSNSALGMPMNFSDDEMTPVVTPRPTTSNRNHSESMDSSASFKSQMRSAPAEHKVREQEEELQRLRTQLEERDKQLREQASSLAEMENSLNEVQSLMSAGSDAGGRRSIDDRDTSQLRAILREKNEKIASLTAEFDAHRADFRSTIDTLEMASTETERVYEQRVEELLQQLHEHQERSEDVHSVAAQLKQLEELVQELEEGLEDARRGESEARGEVEFLRGEVERGRAELRREREKIAELHEKANEKGSGVAKEVAQRDEEIRGLKAVIHSMSHEQQQALQQSQAQRRRSSGAERRVSSSMEAQKATEKLEGEMEGLRRALEAKIHREEELERELQAFRRGSRGSINVSSPQQNNQRDSSLTLRSRQSNGAIKDDKPLPDTPVNPPPGDWRQRTSASPELQRKLPDVPESDTYSATTDDSALWCEICETGGHDILTCTNMFGTAANANAANDQSQSQQQQQQQQQRPGMNRTASADSSHSLNINNAHLPPTLRTGKDVVRDTLQPYTSNEGFKPAPLSPAKREIAVPPKAAPIVNVKSGHPPPPTMATLPNLAGDGPVAGKESGVIDANKWCALCERDGHESVDCPFEDAF